MIEFMTQLEIRITDIAQAAVGVGTDPTTFVRTFDDHLHDVEKTELPFLVVSVRTMDDPDESSIGVDFGPREWQARIYYMDIDPEFVIGKVRRGTLLGKLVKALNANRRLNNLEVIDTDGHREYVYNTKVTNGIFDYSGQDGYYTFVTELYLTVQTDRT